MSVGRGCLCLGGDIILFFLALGEAGEGGGAGFFLGEGGRCGRAGQVWREGGGGGEWPWQSPMFKF